MYPFSYFSVLIFLVFFTTSNLIINNTEEHQENAKPLQITQTTRMYLIFGNLIAHENHREKNTEELSSSRDCRQNERREVADGVQNEHLPDRAAETKNNGISQTGLVLKQKDKARF